MYIMQDMHHDRLNEIRYFFILGAACTNSLSYLFTYEGRPINKLQNGTILLIFKI